MNDIAKQSNEVLAKSPIIIKNEDDVKKASLYLKTVNKMIKAVKSTFDPICKKAKEAHSEAVAKKKMHLDPLEDKKKEVNSMLVAYEEAQMLIQKAEAAKKEQERLEKMKEAEESGEEVEEDFLASIENETPSEIAKPKGMTFRDNWKVRVIDVNSIPREYMVPDMVKIGQYARMHKEHA